MDLPRTAFILVFAAASLTDALREIGSSWERSTGVGVTFNFGASSLLARQIREGAPADLFLSADEAQMDGLENAGLVEPGTRRSMLSNTLVIVVPEDSPLRIASERDLAGPRVSTLALAEPTSVPVGVYSKRFLEGAGVWKVVSSRIVPTESARATLAAVASGNVDAGIVYRTDALISRKVKIAFEIPAAAGPAIAYPFALVKGAPQETAARRFLEHLRSRTARTIFARHGFLVKD
ncbi:MAG: molybdate ABC transporter substrate-binding protein [Thermoanaerobaculia bacterium]|nr:molybdate ABC transporter substrate-binding protein [Thermoanaerobaculia bacterium]